MTYLPGNQHRVLSGKKEMLTIMMRGGSVKSEQAALLEYGNANGLDKQNKVDRICRKETMVSMKLAIG